MTTLRWCKKVIQASKQTINATEKMKILQKITNRNSNVEELLKTNRTKMSDFCKTAKKQIMLYLFDF